MDKFILAKKRIDQWLKGPYDEETKNQINAITIRYDTEKKEEENKNLKKDQIKQPNYFIAIIGLILIIVLVIYNRYYTKKRANKLLTSKNIEIRNR